MLIDLILEPAMLMAMGLAILAGLIRGFTGFGSAMVMAPPFALFFSPAETVAIVLFLEYVVSAPLIPGAWRNVEWRLLVPLAIGAWIATPLGVWALLVVDETIMRRVIAGTVLTFVLILSTGWRYKRQPRTATTFGFGMLSGTFGSATGMTGPPVVLYLLSGANSPIQVRATVIIFFLLADFPPLIGLAINDVIDQTILLRTLILAPVIVVSAWLGGKGFRSANATTYRRVTLGFLSIIAVTVLVI